MPQDPTEKAQVVIAFAQSNTVLRFNSLKKAEKEHRALLKAWDAWMVNMHGSSLKERNRLHNVDGDMFVSTVDLAMIVHVDFVDIAKRVKFIPWVA